MTIAAQREAARQRLPGALSRAMTANRVRQVDLARELGVRPATVSEWTRGIRVPSMEFAGALRDLAPGLGSLLVTAHTVECDICGATTIQGKRNARKSRYCSPACKATAHDRRQRNSRASMASIAKRRLVIYREAVEAMCRECTAGEMLCVMAECPLRPVSPVPLAREARRAAA